MKYLDMIDIIPKRDTLENWNRFNPVLNEYELCCVLTKHGKCKWKVGDGKTPFKKLKYTNKISDIQKIILYTSRLEASTEPKYVTVRNAIIHINPFNINDNEPPFVVSKTDIRRIFGKRKRNESENIDQASDE